MAANDFKGASPAALSAGRKRPNFSEADLYCAARMRLFNCDELYRWRVNPADFFLNQLLGVEGTGVPTEFSLGVVSHDFKRIIAVAVMRQSRCCRRRGSVLDRAFAIERRVSVRGSVPARSLPDAFSERMCRGK